jgi:hypothetical protein
MKIRNWEELPVLLTIGDLRTLGLSRATAYEVAHVLGRRLGKKYFLPRDRFRAWVEEMEPQASGE